MKRIIRGLAVAGFLAVMTLQANAAEWLTDAVKAQEQAKKEKKLVLLDFTGSDWCGWCIKIDEEIFDTKAFGAYAKTNVVLVKVDFPKRKKLDEKQTAANQALAAKYGVQGFPTLVVLSSDGREVGRQGGYRPGGTKMFTAWLDGLKKK